MTGYLGHVLISSLSYSGANRPLVASALYQIQDDPHGDQTPHGRHSASLKFSSASRIEDQTEHVVRAPELCTPFRRPPLLALSNAGGPYRVDARLLGRAYS